MLLNRVLLEVLLSKTGSADADLKCLGWAFCSRIEIVIAARLQLSLNIWQVKSKPYGRAGLGLEVRIHMIKLNRLTAQLRIRNKLLLCTSSSLLALMCIVFARDDRGSTI